MSEAISKLESDLYAGLKVLGLELSALQVQQFLNYVELLLKWGRVYNLTALRQPEDILTHHLLDCLAVVQPLRQQLAQQVKCYGPLANLSTPTILDVGSGAGLPGAAFAISEPNWQLTCVDTVAKKVGFVRQVASMLGLKNLQSRHTRVETLPAQPAWQVITARAFASLFDLIQLSSHLLADEGIWLAMKGQIPHDEIQALPANVEVFHVEPLVVPGLNAQRCLVWMRKRF